MPQKRQHTPYTKPHLRRRANKASGANAFTKHASSTKRTSAFSRKTPGGFGSAPANTPTSLTGSAGTSSFAPEVVLSRRNLLLGAAGIAGVALVGGIGTAAVDAYNGSTNTAVSYLSVPESAVTDLETFTQTKASDAVSLEGSYELTFNTQVWADNNALACCLVPGKTSDPLNTIELLSLTYGSTYKAITKAQGASEGFQIFDARCSQNGIVWVECNVLENRWRVYTAALSGVTPEAAVMVDEGDSTWLTPSIAAVGNTAFWQVMPAPSTKNVPEESGLKAAVFTGGAPRTIYASNKAFATRVTPASDGVVITPRVDTAGVYYQLVKINESSLETEDSLTLPASMKPYEATWGKTGFSFAFENIYNYGEGIANLGTYTPLSKPQAYSYENIPWFHFTRTPSSAPAWCGDWFVVRSTRALCGINLKDQSYFMIDTPSFTDTYGEYLASSGSTSRIVGLSQITNVDDSSKNHALIRVYSPR